MHRANLNNLGNGKKVLNVSAVDSMLRKIRKDKSLDYCTKVKHPLLSAHSDLIRKTVKKEEKLNY
jgi:hypothetical protein